MALTEDKVTKLMDLLKIPAKKQNFEELHNQIQILMEENTKLMAFYLSKTNNTLEKILNNPGLQHLAEKIFENLNYDYLVICQGINQSSKQILEYQMSKPLFFLRKFKGLSEENQKDWTKIIESAKNSKKEKAISAYLRWNLKKDSMVNLPCYSSSAVQEGFRSRLRKISQKKKLFDEDIDIVKILAPLTDNSNALDICGRTPIHWAARNGHSGIVKILAPLTDNPNAPDNYGRTPIYEASHSGHKEIVKILAPNNSG